MSEYIRIIPRLDIKGPNLVKGINLEGLRVLGKPERFAKYYYEKGADELLYMDIVASLYGRNNLLDIVSRTSKEIYIPLTVAGGLRTIEDIQMVLFAGADKVALNTAAICRPELITEAAKKFGSSTIVISIEAKKQPDGSYEAYIDNGREQTGVEVFKWVKQAEELGAGEILITSIDKEGTGNGFDIDLTRHIAESVQIPVIACGGAGKLIHIYDAVKGGMVDAVSIASILHYNFLMQYDFEDDFSSEGNIDFFKNKKSLKKIQNVTFSEIKEYLIKNDIKCRYSKDSRMEGGNA